METSRRLAGGFTTNQQQQEVTVVGSRFGLEPLSNKDAHDFSLVVVMVEWPWWLDNAVVTSSSQNPIRTKFDSNKVQV